MMKRIVSYAVREPGKFVVSVYTEHYAVKCHNCLKVDADAYFDNSDDEYRGTALCKKCLFELIEN